MVWIGRIESQPPAPIRAFARPDHRREADASIGTPAQRGRGPEKDEAPVVGMDGDHRVLERTDVKRLHERPVQSGIAASIEPADAIAKARCRRDIDDPSLGRNGEPANLRRRAEVGPAGAVVARHQHVTVPGEQERSGGPGRDDQNHRSVRGGGAVPRIRRSDRCNALRGEAMHCGDGLRAHQVQHSPACRVCHEAAWGCR